MNDVLLIEYGDDEGRLYFNGEFIEGWGGELLRPADVIRTVINLLGLQLGLKEEVIDEEH